MGTLRDQLKQKIEFLKIRRAAFNENVDRQLETYRAALVIEQQESDAVVEIGKDSLPHGVTDFVRDRIMRSVNKGVSASEIRKAAIQDGLITNSKFPHNILWKLKNRGEIAMKAGRYFAPNDAVLMTDAESQSNTHSEPMPFLDNAKKREPSSRKNARKGKKSPRRK